MRLIHLLPLLPIALAAPTKQDHQIPGLAVSEWASIQDDFFGGVARLTDWSYTKAQEISQEAMSGDGEEELTIWQQLKADPHSFSRLTKIIEFEEKAIKYLDDKDGQSTFFAPNNDALEPPKHHRDHHDHNHDDAFLMDLAANPSLEKISALVESPSFAALAEDDDHDKKKKEIIKHIIGKVLEYHGLPKAYTAQEIAENSTIATASKADDGSYGGMYRRIKVEKQLIPPAVKLNFYAKLLTTDKKARNGYLHTLDHPLIPPPSLFEVLYLFPDYYSTLTSVVQKLNVTHFLDYKYDKEASSPDYPKFTGTGLATLFAPTNVAFGLLPPRLKFFLFSPLGEKALRKLLAYHYIPDTLFLSELLVDERKKKEASAWGFSDEVEKVEMFDEPTFKKEFDIQPDYPNATLHIEVEKKYVLPIEGATQITIKVNGEYTLAVDAQARNGAFHPIGKLLVPAHKHHDHDHDHDGEDISSIDSWDNWEDWFPAWVDEV